MADMNCSACEDIRQTSPEFVVNGLTDEICSSLANDTGLSPTDDHNDCTDLNNLNDCLIGNQETEVDAYDVCDWKPFMKQFIPNLWTVLKAIICAVCGLWTRMSRMCTSIDNILALIRGNTPKAHLGTFNSDFKSRVSVGIYPSGGPYTPSVDNLKPSFNADILNGMGCESGRQLGRWNVTWVYDQNIYPYVLQITIKSEIPIGTVIGVIPRSAVPDSDMSLSMWKNVLSVHRSWQWFYTNDSYINVRTAGYVVIDGVALNPQYAQYGENNMVIVAGPYVGNSTTGSVGGIDVPVHSYDL